MQNYRLFLFIAILVLPIAEIQAAKFYKWVDAEGTTHYTENPPPDDSEVKADVVKTQGNRSAPRTTSSTDDDGNSGGNGGTGSSGGADASGSGGDSGSSGSAASGEEETEEQKQARYCEQMRKNVELLKSGKRVKVKNDDGSSAYLEEEQMAAQLADTEKRLQDCK